MKCKIGENQMGFDGLMYATDVKYKARKKIIILRSESP